MEETKDINFFTVDSEIHYDKLKMVINCSETYEISYKIIAINQDSDDVIFQDLDYSLQLLSTLSDFLNDKQRTQLFTKKSLILTFDEVGEIIVLKYPQRGFKVLIIYCYECNEIDIKDFIFFQIIYDKKGVAI